MDRNYFEYSQIVESFINQKSSRQNITTDQEAEPRGDVAVECDRERRMKLAFINVLHEELPEAT